MKRAQVVRDGDIYVIRVLDDQRQLMERMMVTHGLVGHTLFNVVRTHTPIEVTFQDITNQGAN